MDWKLRTSGRNNPGAHREAEYGMNAFKKVVLYCVPLFSMGVFIFYVWTAGGPWAGKWGQAHGIDVAIVNNYRYVNLVSLLAWTTALTTILFGNLRVAQLSAVFGCGFVLCDIVFYVPMSQLAGEHLPFDQFTVFAVQAAYAFSLPQLAPGPKDGSASIQTRRSA